MISSALLGLLLIAAPAHAVSLTANPANPLASGTFSVNVDPLGNNLFSISVTGNNDGLTDPAQGPVKHSVSEISLGFLRADFSSLLPDAAQSSGSTTSGGSFIGANWLVVSAGGAAKFESPTPLNDLAPFGGNSFLGTVQLVDPDVPVLLAVSLSGGTQQWFGQVTLPTQTAALAPEPGSLVLALPGLLPLVVLTRRNRSSRASERGRSPG